MRPLSSRLSRIRPSGVRELFEIASRYKDVINLTLGEPEISTPRHIIEAAYRAMREGFTHYTTNLGIKELREAIADRYEKEYGVAVDPDKEILVTQGATQAILMCMAAILDKGDEVIVVTPAFVAYFGVAEILESRVIEAPTSMEKGFKPDVGEIERLITSRTKLIIVNSPCNPTGAVYSRDLLSSIVKLANEYDLYVISDEVYEKFVFEGEHNCILSVDKSSRDRLIVVGSFSKTYAMTGWRLGYVIAPDSVISNMVKFQMYNGVCPGSFVQKAAVEALRGPHEFIDEYRRELLKRREYSYSRLREIEGVEAYRPEGALYIFPRIMAAEDMGSIEFCKRLIREERVALVPGSMFGSRYDGYVRISLTTNIENLEEAFNRLERFLSKLTR